MSTLESFIWHLIGYSAIPLILLTGIALSTLVYLFLLKLAKAGEDE